MQKAIETIHLVAQYLAAAAISFTEPQDDDSHTNLGFETTTARLETHPLNESGSKLAFDYFDFALIWQGGTTQFKLNLADQKHQDVVSWLIQTAKTLSFEAPYKYKFHYDLPYSYQEDSVIKKPADDQLRKLVDRRKLAQRSCEQFAELLYRPVAIRIWPHHFDTGGYATHSLDQSFGVGWGMAIADSVTPNMYFYIGYYKNGEPFLPENLPELSLGRWSRKGFTGAIMPIEQYLPAAFAFFAEVHKVVD